MATSEEANLRVLQQRVVNKCVREHFGNRMRVKEIDLADIGSKYIRYTIEHKQIEEHKIIYYYRDLSKLIQHNSEYIFAKNIGIINKVEMVLGGSLKGRPCMNYVNHRKI